MLRSGSAPGAIETREVSAVGSALERAAATFAAMLRTGYWEERFIDRVNGGFSVKDRWSLRQVLGRRGRDGARPVARWLRAAASPIHRARLVPPPGKHLMAHSRLVWSLAHLAYHGLTARPEACREALEHGYRFLVDVLQDKVEGGFFWRTDEGGGIADDSKLLVGQSFAVYALVEAWRATGDEQPLVTATRTFRRVHRKLHDDLHGGWNEIASRELVPLRRGRTMQEAGFRAVTGSKSLNGHLHWMEALTELYRDTGDRAVGAALEECVKVNLERFGQAAGLPTAFVDETWRPVAGESGETSYGHLVELAWLAAEAERALGREPCWPSLDALVDETLEWGFDHRRGGFYLSGPQGHPATRTDKLWWVQAEGLLALLQRLERRPDERVGAAFVALVNWIVSRQVDPRRGVWIWATDERGRLSNFVLAASWKAGYHEVRAMSRLLEVARLPWDGVAASREVAEGQVPRR